ncbi:type IV pilus assembly PilZ [Magnetococcus marinus MC-1]|uniref:Type IV pilus assembly PilZ n=1 Tax=Magnetococcus marinus (strain ATCC BAA-1437 / JCM 17883 / MC-1) TaxID=156889 RepID=A0L912_MAGMM|nr:PilZ domain-containing protein [Magnetococcus marinus]ABK44455.1 type IV pilus assembly PilZ [Magnetococcus marinus MC-1]
MAEKISQSQREFVRIDDLLPLAWQSVEPEAYAKIAEYYENHRIFPPTQGGLNQSLKSLDIRDMLQDLQRTDPNLSHILGRLDQKLNLLLKLFHPQDNDLPMALTPVNLSGGGLAFWEQDPSLESGTIIQMRLALSEDALFVVECYARVIVVIPNDRDGMTRVAVKFDPVLPHDREQIIQHIFRRQNELLRTKKGRRS